MDVQVFICTSVKIN
jgi:hypothetical protein